MPRATSSSPTPFTPTSCIHRKLKKISGSLPWAVRPTPFSGRFLEARGPLKDTRNSVSRLQLSLLHEQSRDTFVSKFPAILIGSNRTQYPLVTRLVASSVMAASQAGKIIRDIFTQGDLNIVDKGVNDLQTEADRSAQNCIIESLSRQFPDVKIIGEEGTSRCQVPPSWIITDLDQEVLKVKLPKDLENVSPTDVCVWVDPLDGTSEFAQGLLDHVTVLVGVAVGPKAVGGVIHQPYYKDINKSSLGRTFWAIEGAGFGGFVPTLPPPGKRIITTTRSHSNKIVQAALVAMQPDEIIRVGGAGHKVVLLLEGKAHAYVFASKGAKRWDTCAPEAILRAAGGNLTDLYGEKYSYDANTDYQNTKGVLATAAGENHSWYISQIPDELKRKM